MRASEMGMKESMLLSESNQTPQKRGSEARGIAQKRSAVFDMLSNPTPVPLNMEKKQ